MSPKGFEEIYQASNSTEIACVCEDLDLRLQAYTKAYDLLNNEDYYIFYQVWCENPATTTEDIVASVSQQFRKRIFELVGDSFRSSTKVLSIFDREGIAYYIIDHWTLNI